MSNAVILNTFEDYIPVKQCTKVLYLTDVTCTVYSNHMIQAPCRLWMWFLLEGHFYRRKCLHVYRGFGEILHFIGWCTLKEKTVKA